MRLIDADALQKEIELHAAGFPKCWELTGYARALVREQPTVDAETVKHGHWVGWTTSAFMGMDEFNEPKWREQIFYRCNRCHSGTVVMSPYCSHCGAKMDEEVQDG